MWAVPLWFASCTREDVTPEMSEVRRLMAQMQMAQAALGSAGDEEMRRRAFEMMERLVEGLSALRPYKDPAVNEKLRVLSAQALAELKSLREAAWDRGYPKRIHRTCTACHEPLGYTR